MGYERNALEGPMDPGASGGVYFGTARGSAGAILLYHQLRHDYDHLLRRFGGSGQHSERDHWPTGDSDLATSFCKLSRHQRHEARQHLFNRSAGLLLLHKFKGSDSEHEPHID